MKQKGLPVRQTGLVPVVIVILITLTLGVYLLYSKQTKLSNALLPTPTSSFESSTAAETDDKKEFSKRQINLNAKFFADIDYPSTITSIPETDLVGLSCTSYYVFTRYSGSKKYYEVLHYDKIGKENFSIDQNKNHSTIYSSLLQVLNRESLTQITICDTEDNRTFVEYGIPSKNTSSNVFPIKTAYAGGGGSDVYFGEFNFANKSFKQIVYIPYEKSAYWGCTQPLQMTKSNIFYLLCAGGEGGGFIGNYRASIYAINVSSNTYKRIILCTYVEGSKPDEAIPSCQ
ncbi:hypothetical protein HYU45_00290 [Candidatus Daviesbacteria bacterium]|nr:hypothetical protein [Candidatus Daviesbacteria bacterium]